MTHLDMACENGIRHKKCLYPLRIEALFMAIGIAGLFYFRLSQAVSR